MAFLINDPETLTPEAYSEYRAKIVEMGQESGVDVTDRLAHIDEMIALMRSNEAISAG